MLFSLDMCSIHASMSAAFTDLPKECAEVEERMLRGEIPEEDLPFGL